MEDDATQSSTATAAASSLAATSTTTGQEGEEDADPIIASYAVFTNPTLPPSRQLLVLQQPNRKLASPADGQHHQQQQQQQQPDLNISEVRLKPRTGMVEVDVPVSHAHADYDREKGLRWGAALQRSVAAKGGGSHGLAGGFGVGVPAARGGKGAGAAAGGRKGLNEEDLDMDMLADWSEAVRRDKVLRTQTLGGQYPLEAESHCRWMVGVFQGDQLHLTPATSLIHLRPQLHHIDAYTEQERLSRPREAGGAASTAAAAAPPSAASGSKDGAGASSSSSSAPGAAAAPRAITMTIKSASANEIAQETMTDRLRAVQTEPWSRLKYEHDTSDRAWDMFSTHLLYKGPSPSSSASTVKDSRDKGKGKEGEEVAAAEQQRESLAPWLTSRWTETEFLRAVSGQPLNGGEGSEGGNGGGDSGNADEVVQVKKEESSATAGGSKAKGKATAPTIATKRAGGKGKSVAFKGAAMEID